MPGRYFWICLLLGVATGCGVETNQPLADPATAEADASLYGHWIAIDPTNKNHEEHLFIGTHKVKSHPESIMEAAWVIWSSDTKTMNLPIAKGPLYFTSTRIGRWSYLNLFSIRKGKVGEDNEAADLHSPADYQKWTRDRKHTCIITRYQCNEKTLEFWDMTEPIAKLDRLKKAGDLTVIRELITAESLVRYLRKHGGDALFDKKVMTFVKSN